MIFTSKFFSKQIDNIIIYYYYYIKVYLPCRPIVKTEELHIIVQYIYDLDDSDNLHILILPKSIQCFSAAVQ